MSSAPKSNDFAESAPHSVMRPTQPRLWRLLAFRLTVWYGGVLAVSAGACFAIGYAVVVSAMRGRTDADLSREAERCTDVFKSEGLPGLSRQMDADARAIGTNDIFFRAYNPVGRLIASSDLSTWTDTTLPPPEAGHRADAFGNGHHRRLRIVTVPTGPGQSVGALQVGVTVQDDQRVVEEVRRTVGLILLGMIAVAVPVGWALARRALAGVQRVTSTANEISRGALGHRVPLSGSGDEVDQLAVTLNRMLERIQTVVEGMEETNDNIAHELRSPITRMRGLAETTLTGRSEIGDYRVMAASTIDECDRLLAMINTMLDIAEAEAGVMSLRRGSVDVTELLREVAELFEPVAAERGVRVVVGGRPAAVQVRGDENRLQRVMSNLVDNAIKYADVGGTVALSARAVDDGRTATVAVENTGPGIAAEALPHVFKRFYRADRGHAGQGNGLGLSLAQAIVQAHGGEIAVHSRPGGPTAFTVTLPVGDVAGS